MAPTPQGVGGGWTGYLGGWGQRGYDRDNMWRPQTNETTWGPSGGYGDNMRMMGTTSMMWGQHGDDVGMTGTMQGRWGPRGDNKITKNAITFSTN